MPRIDGPPELWRSLFTEVDFYLTESVHLHCCGGFVMTQLYAVARTTSDVDFIGVVPNLRSDLIEIGGDGSALHQKHKVYLDAVRLLRRQKTMRNGWRPCFPVRGLASGSSRLRAMIWLFPSWSGISNVIETTCSNSRKRGI
jgi:hypothetical protein